MNSQTLTIGRAESDTDNDFTGGSKTPSVRSSSVNRNFSGSDSNSDSHMPGHMPLDQAMSVVQAHLSQQSQESQQSQSSQIAVTTRSIQQESQSQQTHTANSGDINWNEYIDDEEWPLQRHMRLAEEAENEERGGISELLTAPPHEIRQRNRQNRNQNDKTAQFREKQLQLVNEQLNLQKMLQENATIANEEGKERLKAATALRQAAEIELRLKELELEKRTSKK